MRRTPKEAARGLRLLLAGFWAACLPVYVMADPPRRDLQSTLTHEQSMASAKADCEDLMNELIPFAEKMLVKHGEFYPYAGAMRPSGEIVWVAGYDGRERPPSMDIIRQIKGEFVNSARQGQYKATAIVYDVRVVLPETGQKSDAVAVSLNHRDGYSVIVMVPYEMEDGKPVFGSLFVQRGEADIFPPL